MAKPDDVAAYILQRQGAMTAMKLQKLTYYSYAWHLVWEEERLFAAPIEAWANGPVVRQLYDNHRGSFGVSEWPWGNAAGLAEHERTSVDAVLGYYAKMTAHELSELTHREPPWQRARADLSEGSRSNRRISDADLFEYYDGLTSAASATGE
jgi:uncharacterized phage-associated protein